MEFESAVWALVVGADGADGIRRYRGGQAGQIVSIIVPPHVSTSSTRFAGGMPDSYASSTAPEVADPSNLRPRYQGRAASTVWFGGCQAAGGERAVNEGGVRQALVLEHLEGVHVEELGPG